MPCIVVYMGMCIGDCTLVGVGEDAAVVGVRCALTNWCVVAGGGTGVCVPLARVKAVVAKDAWGVSDFRLFFFISSGGSEGD
jgi:hypothetical protein